MKSADGLPPCEFGVCHPRRKPRDGRHPAAKLIAAQVREIRAALPEIEAGRLTRRDLATHYGVSPSTITGVLGGRVYRGVE
jgi:hypothetical protein